MAIVLKEGKTFNPSISSQFGVDMTSSNYYGVIDRVEYDKNEKQGLFTVDIYGSKELRGNKATIVDRINISIGKDEFDNKIGSDGINIPECYDLVLSILEDWKSDE